MSEELDRIPAGTVIGPYRIIRAFKGRGGMARVFEVEVREKYRRPDLPRRLALKVAKQTHQASLVAEADFLSRFRHPNVVHIFPLPGYHRPVFAAREDFPFGWGWYYAMELLDGGSLDRRLSRTTALGDTWQAPATEGRRLPILEALGIARQIAAALEHIHERHVINLDVKPGNVLFRRRRFEALRGSVPQAVLCDFGIARDVRYAPRSDLLGVATPEYVSPEQAMESGRGRQPVDARSDLFSLGIMLYEMLGGRMPFANIALIADLTYAPLPLRQLCPTVPPALEAVVMRALAKDPNARFQTAAEMRAALEALPTPFDWRGNARRFFAAAAVVACVAAGGLGLQRLGVLPSRPVETPVATMSPTAMATEQPVVVPTTPPLSPMPSPTQRLAPTSTPMPTCTPTPTFAPTATPTPEG